MLVAAKDGTCRECGGQLKVIDADDATMTVECLDCGDSYLVEPDAFGDGAMTYYPQAMVELGEPGEEAPARPIHPTVKPSTCLYFPISSGRLPAGRLRLAGFDAGLHAAKPLGAGNSLLLRNSFLPHGLRMRHPLWANDR